MKLVGTIALVFFVISCLWMWWEIRHAPLLDENERPL